MRLVLGVLMTSLLLWTLPVQGQVSDAQIVALVEALRLVAADAPRAEGLYSPWRIKPSNIPRWSRLCIGEELTPQEFEEDFSRARNILVCVMEDVFRKEYPVSGNNESVAVRRAAAWWMTGDPSQYNKGDIGKYTERVLGIYQELRINPSDFGPSRSMD